MSQSQITPDDLSERFDRIPGGFLWRKAGSSEFLQITTREYFDIRRARRTGLADPVVNAIPANDTGANDTAANDTGPQTAPAPSPAPALSPEPAPPPAGDSPAPEALPNGCWWGVQHFSRERRVLFCDFLSVDGNVRGACARVGVSAQTAYRARRRDPLFAQAWDAALLLARNQAESVLAQQALQGIEEPVFYRGEEVGQRRRYDTRLLLAHLARLDAAAERPGAAEAEGRFDEMLAQLGGQLALGEEPLPGREEMGEERAREAEAAAMAAVKQSRAIQQNAEGDDEYEDEDPYEDEDDLEEWSEEEWNAIRESGQAARAAAHAEWAARQSAICDWVDGVTSAPPAARRGGEG